MYSEQEPILEQPKESLSVLVNPNAAEVIIKTLERPFWVKPLAIFYFVSLFPLVPFLYIALAFSSDSPHPSLGLVVISYTIGFLPVSMLFAIINSFLNPKNMGILRKLIMILPFILIAASFVCLIIGNIYEKNVIRNEIDLLSQYENEIQPVIESLKTSLPNLKDVRCMGSFNDQEDCRGIILKFIPNKNASDFLKLIEENGEAGSLNHTDMATLESFLGDIASIKNKYFTMEENRLHIILDLTNFYRGSMIYDGTYNHFSAPFKKSEISSCSEISKNKVVCK